MSRSFLLEKIPSIREGSSCRANARLTKRPQAEVLKLIEEEIKEQSVFLTRSAKAGL